MKKIRKRRAKEYLIQEIYNLNLKNVSEVIFKNNLKTTILTFLLPILINIISWMIITSIKVAKINTYNLNTELLQITNYDKYLIIMMAISFSVMIVISTICFIVGKKFKSFLILFILNVLICFLLLPVHSTIFSQNFIADIGILFIIEIILFLCWKMEVKKDYTYKVQIQFPKEGKYRKKLSDCERDENAKKLIHFAFHYILECIIIIFIIAPTFTYGTLFCHYRWKKTYEIIDTEKYGKVVILDKTENKLITSPVIISKNNQTLIMKTRYHYYLELEEENKSELMKFRFVKIKK